MRLRNCTECIDTVLSTEIVQRTLPSMHCIRCTVIRFFLLVIATVAFLLASVHNTFAASLFSDLATDHPYYEHVLKLAKAGVVNGNPDGTFRPEVPVNRAAMLKMLYLAAGIAPNANAKGCFQDIVSGSWYEAFVCDAVSRNFVQGYVVDKTFRPDQTVNRVEALKMTFAVFGIPVPEVSANQTELVYFPDVVVNAWYEKYVGMAYATEIMPLPQQNASYFFPEAGLKRGEAAALIVRTQLFKEQAMTGPVVSSKPAATRSSSSSSSSSSAYNNVIEVQFPFAASGTFIGMRSRAYRFSIGESNLALFTADALDVFEDAGIRCTVFLLGEDGYSEEYYLGTQEGKRCQSLAYLTPGSYQLELIPLRADISYVLSAERSAAGDGNDGYSQAKQLRLTSAQKPEVLAGQNLENWYTFTVTERGGKRMSVELSNASDLRCTVYALKDVDMYGFQSPVCNASSLFQPGTYVVSVGRKNLQPVTVNYVIRLQQ